MKTNSIYRELSSLLEKFYDGSATTEEEARLVEILREYEGEEYATDKAIVLSTLQRGKVEVPEDLENDILRAIEAEKRPILRWKVLRYAAAIAAFAVLGLTAIRYDFFGADEKLTPSDEQNADLLAQTPNKGIVEGVRESEPVSSVSSVSSVGSVGSESSASSGISEESGADAIYRSRIASEIAKSERSVASVKIVNEHGTIITADSAQIAIAMAEVGVAMNESWLAMCSDYRVAQSEVANIPNELKAISR